MVQTSFNILYCGGSNLRDLQCQSHKKSRHSVFSPYNRFWRMFAFEHISGCPWGSQILISCSRRDGFQDSCGPWLAEARWMAKMGICHWSPGRISSPDLWCVPGACQIGLATCGSPGHWIQELLVKLASSGWDAQARCPVWRSSVAFHTAGFVTHRTDPESPEHLV